MVEVVSVFGDADFNAVAKKRLDNLDVGLLVVCRCGDNHATFSGECHREEELIGEVVTNYGTGCKVVFDVFCRCARHFL